VTEKRGGQNTFLQAEAADFVPHFQNGDAFPKLGRKKCGPHVFAKLTATRVGSTQAAIAE